jgi:hypothetical protein
MKLPFISVVCVYSSHICLLSFLLHSNLYHGCAITKLFDGRKIIIWFEMSDTITNLYKIRDFHGGDCE